MRIHALTVSVQYADWLAYSIDRWAPYLSSWTIVTDLKDEATVELARSRNLNIHRTNVFYEGGATFNKGAALEEARRQVVPWEDWFLLIDADIVPERGWFSNLVQADPRPGSIYGAWRYQCEDLADIDNPEWKRITSDGIAVGYFQLFHTSDLAIRQLPVIETCWRHGGVYDCHLKDRWPATLRVPLPIRLTHLGERDNWWGRGNTEAFAAMLQERRRCGGYDHERIDG